MPSLNRDIRVLIDEFDVSADHRGGRLGYKVPVLDTTALQAGARMALPGASEGSIDLNAYWIGGNAIDIETKLRARFGGAANAIVSVLLNTLAVGNPAYVMPAVSTADMKTEMPMKELLMLASNWQAPLERGLSVAHGSVAATGGIGATGIDFTTAGAAGGWGVLHVRSITGAATNAAITLQSSSAAAMTSPTTHGTFTFSAVGAYLITWSGATGRYIRLNCTTLGGATGFAVTGIAGVTGVTG